MSDTPRQITMGVLNYRAFKDQVAHLGRDPNRIQVCPAVYVIVSETAAIADEKRAIAEATAKEIDQLALLSDGFNFDFGSKSIDEPLTDAELESISGLHARRDRVIEMVGDRNPTVRDFMDITGRGTLDEHVLFCGTPSQVADELEAWFTAPACDGFVLAAASIPGTYEDFVRLVVPELQRRGLYHQDYGGVTLRENLGLPMATIGDWNS